MTEPRRASVVGSLADDVDALLVTKLVNVRYLSGFTGSNAALLVARDGSAVLATDGRYVEQARADTGLDILETRSLGPDLVRHAGSRRYRRIAIERHHVTLDAFDQLTAAADDVVFADARQAVERRRVHKDAGELALLTQACAATDAAFTAILRTVRPGRTERDIAWELLQSMRENGADAASFDSIVASGPHSAIPHHQPTDRAIESGDLLKLDFGALVGGYHADMTRTVVCGAASDWQRDLHAAVQEVQHACRVATVAGAVPVALDEMARELIRAGGHQLVHGLGHGVGLEIHEQPFLVPASRDERLEASVPVTVEPGIYLPGRGGVRIEDTVVVTDEGAQPLTTSTRELVEIT